MFTITINTSTQAFDGDPLVEVKRILAELSECITSGGTSGVLWDRNIYNVGEWVLSK
jgi:hypothetical protein